MNKAQLTVTWTQLSKIEQATLSNSICGDPVTVLALESKGLVTNVCQEIKGGRELSFFELSEYGESLHYKNCVIASD